MVRKIEETPNSITFFERLETEGVSWLEIEKMGFLTFEVGERFRIEGDGGPPVESTIMRIVHPVPGVSRVSLIDISHHLHVTGRKVKADRNTRTLEEFESVHLTPSQVQDRILGDSFDLDVGRNEEASFVVFTRNVDTLELGDARMQIKVTPDRLQAVQMPGREAQFVHYKENPFNVYSSNLFIKFSATR